MYLQKILTINFSIFVKYRHNFLARHTSWWYVCNIYTSSRFEFLFYLISLTVHFASILIFKNNKNTNKKHIQITKKEISQQFQSAKNKDLLFSKNNIKNAKKN